MPGAAKRFALQYHPDGYATQGVQPLGRRVAGEEFLRALALHGGLDEIVGLVTTQPHAKAFAEHIAALNPALAARAAFAEDPGPIAAAGTLFIPGPGFASQAWARRRGAQNRYSLLGITHTTATTRVMTALADNLTAPVQPWDAIICTSRAVRAMVARVMEEQSAYLRDRFGAARVEWPQLPILPLGVDAAAFTPRPGTRPAWREKLGIGETDIAILCVARWSHETKFNPLPLFIALHHAQNGMPERRFHLILAGWYENDYQSALFAEGAKALCPTVPVHDLDGRLPDVRRDIWAAADIFTLPVDNVQETFGIAPIEAMAAGLPVVIGDWDGYRDTVVHGETGLAVATMMAGPLDDLGFRHEIGADSYGRYCASVAQGTALDLGGMASAFKTLAGNPDLRRRMGEAGRRRVAEEFDWRVVVPRYLELAGELGAQRARGGERVPVAGGRPANPAAQDPFELFAEYPLTRMTPEQRFALMPGTTMEQVQTTAALRGAVVNGRLLPGLPDFRRMLAALEAGPCTGHALAAACAPLEIGRVMRGLGWLMKFGMLIRSR